LKSGVTKGRARPTVVSVLPLPEKSAQGLTIHHRQNTRRVKIGPLRRLTKTLLVDYLLKTKFDLSVCLVNTAEITSLNESFLHHKGPTDVITFDYSETGAADSDIFGEIFICIDQAVSQARRFRTTWQSELVRYIVHGLLHLCGYDDDRATSRREMKVAEDCLVRQLARRFDFAELGD
jgi:probable rRNA maturation factor